jgi:hypothetical protein
MALPIAGILNIVRTGLTTLYNGASIICAIAPFAVEKIQAKYPTNTALLDAVKNVQAGCQVMRLLIIEQQTADAAASAPDLPPIPVAPPEPVEPPE